MTATRGVAEIITVDRRLCAPHGRGRGGRRTGAGAMLVACRLAGLSALGADYAGDSNTQCRVSLRGALGITREMAAIPIRFSRGSRAVVADSLSARPA